MMQMLCDHIDQLDLALDQLALKDRNFDRFAIMLVDNVVELVLHQHALREHHLSKLRYPAIEPKFSAKVLEKALGQQFDGKVEFALQTDLISKLAAQSVSWLHWIRNSSYHAGLRHEGILHSVANFYVINCCDILRKYKPAIWSFGPQRPSHRAAKYLGDTDNISLLWDAATMFEEAWDRLRRVAVNMDCNLVEDLARDMASTIDAADDSLEFIAANDPFISVRSRKQAVVDAQVWALAFTKKGVQYAERNGYPGQVGQGPALARWLVDNYDLPYPVDPIPSWRSRLRSLGLERDEHNALHKYCCFIKETRGVREEIARRAQDLSGHIQEQIDLARGK